MESARDGCCQDFKCGLKLGLQVRSYVYLGSNRYLPVTAFSSIRLKNSWIQVLTRAVETSHLAQFTDCVARESRSRQRSQASQLDVWVLARIHRLPKSLEQSTIGQAGIGGCDGKVYGTGSSCLQKAEAVSFSTVCIGD